MILNVKCILIITLFFVSCYAIADDQNTLQQLHVVFRHGDRNPVHSNLYPNDPNRNDTWAPDGLDQLTMYGKMQEFLIGKALRERYDQFLGEIYTTNVIEPLSTEYNRTKMSLLLVLAGLYPPAPSQIWNVLLPWQPIPINYVSSVTDPVMGLSLLYCKKYKNLSNETQNSDYFQSFWKSSSHLIEYIKENSGANITKYFDLYRIYDALNAEVATGRKIPKWTEKVFPQFLTQVANLYFELLTYTDEMNKLAGGNMLKKILEDMHAKQHGTLSPKERKIYLYSGHEYNVAFILGALKLFKPHVPPYGSYVVVELHKIDNVYGVKILYQDYKQAVPQYLTVPGCAQFCPLDQFVDLKNSVIPTNEDKC